MSSSVSTGKHQGDVVQNLTRTAIVAQDVGCSSTEPSAALVQRRKAIRCIYHADAWEVALRSAGLSARYPYLVQAFRNGFIFDFPSLLRSQCPPNCPSVSEFSSQFLSIVGVELEKGRYIGPFTQAGLESLIGHFQTSPFSIIPKPGRPGKFRIIQNFSFPQSTTSFFPNPSINSYTYAINFPCTFGGFNVACFLLGNLPPGSEVAIRDVAEAFRTIPLHPSQWPAAVVRLDEDMFCVDTCAAFGAHPSGGVYGFIQDAALDIFRHRGLGPAVRWVDDHLFARILREFLTQYNEFRLSVSKYLVGQRHQSGGRIWYGGGSPADGSLVEADEDCCFPVEDLSSFSDRGDADGLFTYAFCDIDGISEELGIPWETSKDSPFASSGVYIGLLWNLKARTVGLAPAKASKYIMAIDKWSSSETHTLEEVQKLYGRLLHTSLILPAGRAYLTGLESMLGAYNNSPFSHRHPPRSVAADLEWWRSALSLGPIPRSIPLAVKLHDLGAFSDASSGVGLGIVIGNRWRAWNLLPGWRTLNGQRDIGWAEAVGFEFLIRTIIHLDNSTRAFKLYGDNNGIVEGWWNKRSQNSAVNGVFKRIHSFLSASGRSESIFTAYVPTSLNPADGPSRGVYPSSTLLLPPIIIPEELRGFITNFDAPSATASQAQFSSNPIPKPQRDIGQRAAAVELFNNVRFSDELLAFES